MSTFDSKTACLKDEGRGKQDNKSTTISGTAQEETKQCTHILSLQFVCLGGELHPSVSNDSRRLFIPTAHARRVDASSWSKTTGPRLGWWRRSTAWRSSRGSTTSTGRRTTIPRTIELSGGRTIVVVTGLVVSGVIIELRRASLVLTLALKVIELALAILVVVVLALTISVIVLTDLVLGLLQTKTTRHGGG